MLVWYRDTTYGNNNHVLSNLAALPSHGSKGGLLLVDSHFDPFRRQGVAADKDPSTLNNLPSRPQSSNAAFGLRNTYPFTECFELLPAEPFSEYCTDFGAQNPKKKFTDKKGWYPGLELRGEDRVLSRRRRVDGRAVGRQPAVQHAVRASGRYAVDGPLRHRPRARTSSPATGNPADDGVAIGVSLEVKKVKKDKTSAQIRVVPAPAPAQ